jgi:predicted Zn-dependent protease
MNRYLILSFALIAPRLQAEGKEEAALGGLFDILRTSQPVKYKQEAQMGETIALQAFSRFGKLAKDQVLLEYVSLVGNTVARASDRPHTPYYFAVCKNNDPNAFAVPGGYVFITTGLLKLVKNEEELAGILGHEIAHITLQHAIKGIRAAKRWGALATVGQIFLNKGKSDKNAEYADLVDNFFDKITETGHGLRYELKADELGIEYAYRAGYRAGGLRDFINTLAQLEKGHKEFSLFKTHRDHDQRVEKIDQYIKKRGFQSQPVNRTVKKRFKERLVERLKKIEARKDK